MQDVDFGLLKLSPENVVAFEPTEESQDRFELLADKFKDGEITEKEQDELEYFQELDHLIRLLKKRAARMVQSRQAA